jgi:alpha-glucosidase (family GH31 glycosyl hydrolase)
MVALLFLLLSVLPLAGAQLEDCKLLSTEKGAVSFGCRGGAQVRLQAVTPEMIRVRVSPDGRFPEPLTVRWGFVRDNFPPVQIKTSSTGGAVLIDTGALRVRIEPNPFRISLLDHAGKTILEQTGLSHGTPGTLQVRMRPDEHFYGLGFQRMALDVRGRKLQWFRSFRSNEATVPFFMSTAGYGFYSNNTWKHVFDFTGGDSYRISSDGGQLDYYLIHGPALKQILGRYTDLTGKPMLPPRWALGIGYEARYMEEQPQVIKTAQGFRREDIPIDWIGLEPGWEDIPYNMKWNWSPKRFPDPDVMIRTLAGMGIKMGLWESGAAPKTGYTDPEVRKQWYSPRIQAAIRKGIKFFKQDDPYPRMISSQEWLPPEMNKALGGDGVFSAAQMNNLTNSLYSATAMEEYTRVTGERAMLMFNGYDSSIASHRWPFTWEADFPLGVGALSASFSGHGLVSTRDRNESPDGIHLGYLAPFSYLEAWAYYKEPWLYSDDLLEMNRFYVKLRYRLLPYLYSSLRQANANALPLMRPMALEFQDDENTHLLATQFMLGDSLLVASATTSLTSGSEGVTNSRESATPGKAPVYLPRGKWYDYWTGRAITSQGRWQTATWPESAGGPLWVKGGAIIPMGPVMSHSDEEPLEVIRLDVYPAGTSRCTIYEDDGTTYAYEKGAFATTEVRAVEQARSVTLSIGARQGSYKTMPARRGYLVSLHTGLTPTRVVLGSANLPKVASKEQLLYSWTSRGWYHDARAGILWIKPEAGWRYDYDARGAAKDPDRDTAYWDQGSHAPRALTIQVSLAEPAPEPKQVYGTAAALAVESQFDKLIADGTSTSAVTVTVLDASKRRVYDSSHPVRIEAVGEAVLGCGARVCTVNASEGVATTTITSSLTPGRVQIRASAGGVESAGTQIDTVRGNIALKASPPERVKLNSDGSWLPLRFNLYATIECGGVRMRSASTRLRMRVTGGSGKLPADLEARAAKGIAVFKDVVLEKPPRYLVVVSGDGLETARIPIY